MKTGLMADVRGMLAPLDFALRILRDEGCDRIACLGSTVEGGADDESVLARLRDESVTVVSSPHDAPGLLEGVPTEDELGGLRLSHELPCGSDDVLWLTGWPAPSLLRAMELLRAQEGGRASGDLYAPMVYAMVPEGVRRRIFLGPGRWSVGDGAFTCCPGSVALAGQSRYGGSVMTWDDASREIAVVTFDGEGKRMPHYRPSILVYCEEFEPHHPDADELKHVTFEVLPGADDIVADVERIKPDVILLDYHLHGRLSGIDAMIALRQGRDALPSPVLTITGNPADSQGMKAAGAVAGLPFMYLKDVTTRLIREIGG
jgi:CheY-like chemotaxis protein